MPEQQTSSFMLALASLDALALPEKRAREIRLMSSCNALVAEESVKSHESAIGLLKFEPVAVALDFFEQFAYRST